MCILFAADGKIRTAQCFDVARFYGRQNPSSKTIFVKEENRRLKDQDYFILRGKALTDVTPKRTLLQVRPFGTFSVIYVIFQYQRSTTTMPGVVCVSCQLVQERKERRRLANEESHIR